MVCMNTRLAFANFQMHTEEYLHPWLLLYCQRVCENMHAQDLTYALDKGYNVIVMEFLCIYTKYTFMYISLSTWPAWLTQENEVYNNIREACLSHMYIHVSRTYLHSLAAVIKNLADVFYLCVLMMAYGPAFTRATIHGIIINTVQSVGSLPEVLANGEFFVYTVQ